MSYKTTMCGGIKVCPDALYTLVEVADLLGVARQTVYQHTHAGKLTVEPELHKGRKVVRGVDIIAFLQEKENNRRRRLKTSNESDALVCRGCLYSVDGPGYGGHVCNYCFETDKPRGIPKEQCYMHEGTPYTPINGARKRHDISIGKGGLINGKNEQR